MVQWLRLHLAMQGVLVRSLVRKLKSYMLHSQKKKNQNIKQKQYCNAFTILTFAKIMTFEKKLDGKTIETVRNFIFGGSKITENGDCSHEIKRLLFLGRKVMTSLDSILKSRDICQQRSI